MSERVFADEFYKGFFREGDFLAFIEEREENSDWEKVKSSELRFYPIADGHRASSMLEEKLREKGKECVFKDTMEHTRLILKVRMSCIRYAVVRLRLFWSGREYPEMH